MPKPRCLLGAAPSPPRRTAGSAAATRPGVTCPESWTRSCRDPTIGREVAVERRIAAGEGRVRRLVMHGFADRGAPDPARVEAALELVQRVFTAAAAPAEVEALVAALTRPRRRFEEEQVHGAELSPLVGARAQVVVQPRRRRQTQRSRDDVAVDLRVEADDARALERLPVRRLKEVERRRVGSPHRLLVKRYETADTVTGTHH